MTDETFVTAICCMDGRVQIPVIEFLKNKFGVDHVDMITEAGPLKYLAGDSYPEKIASIRHRTEISVTKHGSKVLAFVGHDKCAGNPVPREEKIKQMETAIELARGWGFDVQYVRLFVGDNWKVEEL